MGKSTFSGPVASQNGFTSASFTTTERNALTNVATGTLIYNSTTGQPEVYTGSAWQAAFTPSTPSFTTPFTYSVNTDYDNSDPQVPGLVALLDGSGTGYLYAATASWSDQTELDNLILMPLGFTGTVDPNSTTSRGFTTTSTWDVWGSGYRAQVTGALALLSNTDLIDSITS